METGEGTLVITNNQFAGRGQRGNTWEAEPGQNLTFSLVLRPRFLTAKDQFQINRVISLGVADYVSQRLGHDPMVKIKWPNDILAGDRKMGGILIENHIQATSIAYSIAGIGLNINQERFSNPKACSLRSIAQRHFVLNDELALLVGCLEARYLDLKQNKLENLERHYLSRLYRKNELHRFTSDGVGFEGEITGVDEVGRLIVRTSVGQRVFGVKEIAFA